MTALDPWGMPCDDMTSPIAKGACFVGAMGGTAVQDAAGEVDYAGYRWFSEAPPPVRAVRELVTYQVARAAESYGIPTPRVRWFRLEPDDERGRLEGRFYDDRDMVGLHVKGEPEAWVRVDEPMATMLKAATHETSHVANYGHGGDRCAYREGSRWREIYLRQIYLGEGG
jgi:hypothetical protein